MSEKLKLCAYFKNSAMKKENPGKISILARFYNDPSQMNKGRLMKI